MDKMLAISVYDEELKSWIVYVDSEGELLPVGRTINEDLGLLNIVNLTLTKKLLDIE